MILAIELTVTVELTLELELLAIKLALKEWKHWLEGAKHQFEVITDDRNLEYLREAQ